MTQTDDNTDHAESYSEEEMLLMAKIIYKLDPAKIIWFIDSGCCNHMCGCKEWFFKLDETFRTTVKLGNNSRMDVLGKGNIKLEIEGKTLVITNVYFIPDLKNHLLSVGHLQENKVKVVFEDNQCRVYHKHKGLVMKSFMSSNRMFAVCASPVLPECFNMTGEEISHLWHRRYAHLSIKGLKTLVSKGLVKGLPHISDLGAVCSDCMKGKQ